MEILQIRWVAGCCCPVLPAGAWQSGILAGVWALFGPILDRNPPRHAGPAWGL